MDIMTIVLVIVLIMLLGGGGGYYFGPWRGDRPANHLVGVVITIFIIAILLRLFGIY